MFFVNSLDTCQTEAKLLAVFAASAIDKLPPKHLRRRLSITKNTTAQPVSVPILRDHVTPQRGFLRQLPPQDFALKTSVSVGMRDAMEVIAHEMIHISQMCHGRMRVQKRRVGAGMSAWQIHIMSWCRAKPPPIDQIEWHKRAWEIEACDWQAILVDEFLVRSSGTVPTVTLQKRKPDKLALYCLPKNPTPAARVTPVSTVPRLSYTPEPQKSPSHVAMTPVITDAELQPMFTADREVEVAGLPSRHRLRQELIEEKRHELPLRGLISQ